MYEGEFKDGKIPDKGKSNVQASAAAVQKRGEEHPMGKVDDRDDQDIMKSFIKATPPEGNKINF